MWPVGPVTSIVASTTVLMGSAIALDASPATLAAALGDAGWTWSSLAATLVTVTCLGAQGIALVALHRRAGVQRGHWLRTLAFGAGLLALCTAVIGPLHAYGRYSLGAHMGQHMLLFAYAPLLLALARPVALWRTALQRGSPRAGAFAPGWNGLGTALVPATAVHSGLMWFWHHPAAITSTLLDDRLQLLMHASFVLSGLWFWSALVTRLAAGREGLGTAMVALVAMMMQMGLLGALLTFSSRVLYPVCSERAPLLGIEPLADQQLAGLIMWVPAGLPYLLGGLWLMQRWLSLPPGDRSPA